MCADPLVLHSYNPVDLKSVLSHEDLIIGLASDHPTVVPEKDCGVGISKLYWVGLLVVPVHCPNGWLWYGGAEG